MNLSRLILLLSVGFLILFTACKPDDPVEDQGSSIEDVIGDGKVESYRLSADGLSLEIVFENGQTATINFPESIQGEDGQDGVGIEDITFDPLTNELKIFLTNGVEYIFVLEINGEGGMDPIFSDVNGKYFVKDLKVGALDLVNITYTNDFQVKDIRKYDVVDGQKVKSSEIIKQFNAQGQISQVTNREFVTKSGPDYYNPYYSGSINYCCEAYSLEYQGSYYLNGDVLGIYRYQSDDQFVYASYNYYSYYYGDYEVDVIKVFEVSEDDYNNGEWADKNQFYLKVAENFGVFYERELVEFVNKDGVSSVVLVYLVRQGVIRAENPELGSLKLEQNSFMSYLSNGKLDKVYASDTDDLADAKEYSQHFYNTAGELIKVEYYHKNAQGEFVKDPAYTTLEYSGGVVVAMYRHEGGESQMEGKVYYDDEEERNPVDIWFWEPAKYDYDFVFDFETGDYVWDKIIIEEAGLKHQVTVEYNYEMKNFFGNSIEALAPELRDFKINRAVRRISDPNGLNSSTMDYQHFNIGGYPETVTLRLNEAGEFILFEAAIDYHKK
ncbi:hypothetical protein [Persicobacter sp. CCB-QB2]|uniref:hypothetical protein n=1 Tax=Persicobacter sp. CCB-QB2 TaxID=1561025 RepID=UPI0006A98400|nr:hypothetical protein [Persicobacter sp. CCB-QB2]